MQSGVCCIVLTHVIAVQAWGAVVSCQWSVCWNVDSAADKACRGRATN